MNGISTQDVFAIVLLADMTDEQYAAACEGDYIEPAEGQRHLLFRHPTVNEHLKLSRSATARRRAALALKSATLGEPHAATAEIKLGELSELIDAGVEEELAEIEQLFSSAPGFGPGRPGAFLKPVQVGEVRQRLLLSAALQVNHKKKSAWRLRWDAANSAAGVNGNAATAAPASAVPAATIEH